MRVFIAVLLLISICHAADDWQKSVSAGKEAYRLMKKQWFSSEESYKNNLFAPLMTGKTMKSLDGKDTSSDVQLMCPGADPVLLIQIQPMATKDIAWIRVRYDSDLNGTLDAGIFIPGPVSGICDDGIIRCNAGTWNQCHFYRYSASYNGGRIVVNMPQESSYAELSSCYCINSSCTSLPFSSYARQVILRLGAGIVHAIVKANPRFSISSGRVDPSLMSISYFSQNARKCAFKDAGRLLSYGFSDADEAFSYNMNLMARTEQEISKQINDPDSMYNLIHQMPVPQGEKRICTKIRSVYFDSTTCEVKESSVNGCAQLENDPECRLEEEKVYDAYGNYVITYSSFSPTGEALLPTCRKIVDRAKAIQCLIECKGDFGTTDGGCPVRTDKPNGVCYNGHVVGYMVSGNTVTLSLEYQTFHGTCGKKAQYPVCGTAYISLVYPSNDDDPCLVIQKDGSNYFKHCCKDCNSGYSFSGNVSTDGIQNVFAKVDDAGACDVVTDFLYQVHLKLKDNFDEICYDWWKIERTYFCQPENLNIDLRRPAHIDATIKPTDEGAAYEDLVKKNGSWTVKPDQKIISSLGDIQGQCIQGCKLRMWVDPASAVQDKTSRDYRYISGHYRYIYRMCEDGSCPVREGEEIVQNCSCINDFTRWMTVNEVFRISAIDEICSSGKKHRH